MLQPVWQDAVVWKRTILPPGVEEGSRLSGEWRILVHGWNRSQKLQELLFLGISLQEGVESVHVSLVVVTHYFLDTLIGHGEDKDARGGSIFSIFEEGTQDGNHSLCQWIPGKQRDL